jgi:hypothetical protein
MNTPGNRPMIAARLVLWATCLLMSVSCGGELLRTGRSPMMLIVERVQAEQGNATGTLSSFLLSDVRDEAGLALI